MRSVLNRIVSMCLVAAALCALQPRPSRADDLRFEKSLDLLMAEMQLKALHVLQERGHYIPAALWTQYQDRYTELTDELRNASQLDLGALDERLDEMRRVHKAETSALRQLAVSIGQRMIREAGGSVEFVHRLRAKMTRFSQRRSMNAVEIARFVELELAPGSKHRKEWGHSARAVYRGAIKDQDKLFQKIVEREKQLLQLESYIVALSCVDQLIDAVQKSPTDHATEWVSSKLENKLLAYLDRHYKDVDHEHVKWAVGKAKKLVTSGWAAFGRYKELGEHASLRYNQTALATARRFAVLSAIYDNTLGIVRDWKIAKALGPLFDVLDFYGQSIGLVPQIAQRLASTFDRVHQNYPAVSNQSDWKILPVNVFTIRKTSLMQRFINLPVATGGDVTEGHENARYFLLVEKDIDPRGYVELGNEQYQRLAHALVDERILNARSEASRSVWDYGLSFLSDAINDSIFSPSVATSYVNSLKEAAKRPPFSERDLLKLARGEAVELEGQKVTAESLAEDRELAVDVMGVEALVREALHDYRQAYYDQWFEFEDILRQHKVPLTRRQILRLFNFYVRSSQRGKVTDRLREIAEERAERRRGRLQAGVVSVSTVSGVVVKPGTKVTLQAILVASDLPPDEPVEARIAWSLPKWAKKQEGQQPVRIRNGLQRVRRDFSIPGNVGRSPFEVKARLIAPQPHQQTGPYAEAATVFRFEQGSDSLPARHFRLIKVTVMSYETKGKKRGRRLDLLTTTKYLPVLVDENRPLGDVLEIHRRRVNERYKSYADGNWRKHLPHPYSTLPASIPVNWKVEAVQQSLRPPFAVSDVPSPRQSLKVGGGPQW